MIIGVVTCMFWALECDFLCHEYFILVGPTPLPGKGTQGDPGRPGNGFQVLPGAPGSSWIPLSFFFSFREYWESIRWPSWVPLSPPVLAVGCALTLLFLRARAIVCRRSQDRQDLSKEAGARRSQDDSKIATGVARRGQGEPAGARSRQDSKSCRRSQEDSQIMSRAARRRPFYLFVWGDEVGNKRTELVSFSIFYLSGDFKPSDLFHM